MTSTTARSILHDLNAPETYRRYTWTNGRKPEGSGYGTEGWLFTLPAEEIGAASSAERQYAAFQTTMPHTGPTWVWVIRETTGNRRTIGRPEGTRNAAVAGAIRAVAKGRDEEAEGVADKRRAAGLDPAGKPYRVEIVDGGGAILHERCACPAVGASRWENRPDAEAQAAEVTAHRDAGWKLCDLSAAPATPAGDGASRLTSAERGAAWRMEAAPTTARPVVERRADTVLRLCRESEERSRPVRVEVGVSRYVQSASLRWIDTEGRECPSTWDLVRLPGSHTDAMTDDVLSAAGLVLAKRGFNYARGEQWQGLARGIGAWADVWERSGVTIVPTRAYLDLQARKFGPLPDVPPVDGVTVKPRTQRGWWDVTDRAGVRHALTWSPRLDGDRWTVQSGPTLSHRTGSGTDPAALLAAL